jgi:Xaa-Pro aminopeptidase
MSSKRIERARALLVERNLDALVISNPYSRRYLTLHTGDDHGPDESGGIAIVGREAAKLIISTNNAEWAASESPDFEIIGWTLPWHDDVAEALKAIGASRVGFEEEALSVADYRKLLAETGERVEWIALEGAIDNLRIIKDEAEIAAIAKASAITDQALTSALSRLEAGDSELDLKRMLEDAMRALGADGPGFGTIVASGPNAARPHHSSGDRRIQPGEPIIIDMGAEVDGYKADLTRTVCIGEPTPELAKVYTIVLDAHRAALASIRAGATGKDVDDAARNVISAAGYGDQFIHGLGHGVGLRIHEGPSASQRSSHVLAAGMTLTVEPGIYIPGWGGVRIENLVVVEEDGCRDLTSVPTRLAVSEMIAGVQE